MREEFYGLIDKAIEKVLPRVIAWRRDIHQHPELPNQEYRTGALVEKVLLELDLTVKTKLAHTGVSGLLDGGKSGPIVALRADMDALPVAEETGLPFASEVKAEWCGRETNVMHACGHDAHTAMLLGAACVLASIRDHLPGSVKFIFQPAEESPPPGENGGAPMMIEDGVLDDPKPEAIFGLHVINEPCGRVLSRPKGIMASQDNLFITVKGRQTHGAVPWGGIDPIVTASQIVMALQTITSRRLPVTTPSVVSIGTFQAGVLNTIIPEQAVLTGSIRTMDQNLRETIFNLVRQTVQGIAAGAGAEATVEIEPELPLTYNDPALYERMMPSLIRAAGPAGFSEIEPITGSEDFSFYTDHVPGLYFFLGINPDEPGYGPGEPCHSPRFTIHEPAMASGIRAMVYLAVDYLFEELPK